MLVLFFIASVLNWPSSYEHSTKDQLFKQRYVETTEDYAHLDYFSRLYSQFLDANEVKDSIPRKFYFIWLGLQNMPGDFEQNILGWKQFHPDWDIELWVDIQKDYSHLPVTVKYVGEELLQECRDLYFSSSNVGEKSAILKYELLRQFGGVYVDCDVTCFRPIDAIALKCDLFSPGNPPERPFLSSSLYAGTYIIGAKPHHPVLESCCAIIKEQWMDLGIAYSGLDYESTIYRTFNRVFVPWTTALLSADTSTSLITILPPCLFSPNPKTSYAYHAQVQSWMDKIKLNFMPLGQSLDHVETLVKKERAWVRKIFVINYMLMALCALLIVDRFRRRKRAA